MKNIILLLITPILLSVSLFFQPDKNDLFKYVPEKIETIDTNCKIRITHKPYGIVADWQEPPELMNIRM
jgi:hypothetical protein